ncbi:hypothetical protein Bpfe_012774, partial [Biomphalaria pfeifferi]
GARVRHTLSEEKVISELSSPLSSSSPTARRQAEKDVTPRLDVGCYVYKACVLLAKVRFERELSNVKAEK